MINTHMIHNTQTNSKDVMSQLQFVSHTVYVTMLIIDITNFAQMVL